MRSPLSVSLFLFLLSVFTALADTPLPVHPWEKQELTFTAEKTYANPYLDVVVWVDLTGPNFSKRIYGFWDGGQVYHLRLLATEPGQWSWKSGSNTNDPGLTGKTGAFAAVPWTEAELQENPL